jgi:hypothetical protein
MERKHNKVAEAQHAWDMPNMRQEVTPAMFKELAHSHGRHAGNLVELNQQIVALNKHIKNLYALLEKQKND